jgi:hypothetical protein
MHTVVTNEEVAAEAAVHLADHSKSEMEGKLKLVTLGVS